MNAFLRRACARLSKMQMNMLRPPHSNAPLGLVRLQFSIQTPKLYHWKQYLHNQVLKVCFQVWGLWMQMPQFILTYTTLPLIVKNKTAQITAGHSFHFKELHLGFREFHLMFLRRVQKPDGRWAKQVSKERHRLGESERWQSCQDKAISNGCAPRCLQSAGGGETGGETQTGCCGCWRPPAVSERTGEKW